MSQYSLSDAAKLDIDELWRFIAVHAPDAADRMVDRLHARFQRVAMMPTAFAFHPVIGEPIRFTVVKPYVVFYAAHKHEIEIIRVLHGHRDIPVAFSVDPSIERLPT